MRILHVIAKMDPATGGVSQAVRTLAGGLTDLGVENEIASMDDRDSSFLENEKAVIYPNGPGKGPWSYCPKLTTWLNENIMRFDAVIVHGLWLYNGFATRRVVNNLIRSKQSTSQPEKVPRLFIMPHGMLDPYFQRAAGRKFKA